MFEEMMNRLLQDLIIEEKKKQTKIAIRPLTEAEISETKELMAFSDELSSLYKKLEAKRKIFEAKRDLFHENILDTLEQRKSFHIDSETNYIYGFLEDEN